MEVPADLRERIIRAVQPQRLTDMAVKLVEVPSPTGQGGAVADLLARLLSEEGFAVERPEAGWPQAPAVAVRLRGARPGRTLQFNGHLDTVHLPFVPPRIENGVLHGSGASDMKGGLAAACEALCALRDSRALEAGSVLLTAHDLHEFPWGNGTQVDRLIEAGYLGDAVLLPEYVHDRLPVAGRGLAVLEARVSRPGEPVHEVLGGIDQPNVIATGAELVRELVALDQHLAHDSHPKAGRASVFIGQVSSGEIYNQSPVEFRLSGTRRWLPGASWRQAESEYRQILDWIAKRSGLQVSGEFIFVRDAFEIEPRQPIVEAFQSAHEAVAGFRLPLGPKPFVDDGNTFVTVGKRPAITHGPDATGAHTVHESVPLAELERVARVYAMTAATFCPT